MDPAAAWLDAHGMDCERYGVRLSPVACQARQMAKPESCEKCDQVVALGTPVRKRGWGFRVNRRGGDMASKTGTCQQCKRPNLTLPGRGLCGKCYGAVLASEKAAAADPAPSAVEPAPVIGGPGTTPAEIHGAAVNDATLTAAGTWWTSGIYADPKTARDKDPAPFLTLRFEPDDAPLLEALEEDARANRRSPDQHLLWILERVQEVGTAKLEAQALLAREVPG